MTVVLDASVTLSWLFSDENSEYAGHVLEAVQVDGAAVPSIWSLEVANALLVAERRRRVSTAEVTRALDLLKALPIEVNDTRPQEVFGPLVNLARELGLSVYDASYLRLAKTQDLPLATLDARLRMSAEAVGVEIALR